MIDLLPLPPLTQAQAAIITGTHFEIWIWNFGHCLRFGVWCLEFLVSPGDTRRGAERDRTADLCVANAPLSHLSYSPEEFLENVRIAGILTYSSVRWGHLTAP